MLPLTNVILLTQLLKLISTPDSHIILSFGVAESNLPHGCINLRNGFLHLTRQRPGRL